MDMKIILSDIRRRKQEIQKIRDMPAKTQAAQAEKKKLLTHHENLISRDMEEAMRFRETLDEYLREFLDFYYFNAGSKAIFDSEHDRAISDGYRKAIERAAEKWP